MTKLGELARPTLASTTTSDCTLKDSQIHYASTFVNNSHHLDRTIAKLLPLQLRTEHFHDIESQYVRVPSPFIVSTTKTFPIPPHHVFCYVLVLEPFLFATRPYLIYLFCPMQWKHVFCCVVFVSVNDGGISRSSTHMYGQVPQ